MLSFTIGKNSISLFFDGTFYSLDKAHVNYATICTELKKPAGERDYALLTEWLNVRKIIALLSAGKVQVAEEGVFYDGREVNNYMTTRMMELLSEGYDLSPWALFMDNVFLNPAEYARDELYEWMEKADMPITPDGHFLAFKKVRDNFTDCHTGTFDNSPGSILEMPREACDPNRSRVCSTGFHFCSVGYLPHFWGERIVVVKINPRDVTSIPDDYGYAKGRCCRYEVVGELSYADSANASCFKQNVADIEDPAEFPPELVKLVPTKRFPTAEEIEQAQRDANRTIAFDLPDITPAEAVDNMLHRRNCWVTPDQIDAVAAAIENDMSDAKTCEMPQEPSRKATTTRQDWETRDRQGTIEAVAKGTITQADADRYLDECAERYDTLFDIFGELRRTHTEPPIEGFITRDKRSFTCTQIDNAMVYASGSIRGAARLLDIQDSTLRGWLKQMGR